MTKITMSAGRLPLVLIKILDPLTKAGNEVERRVDTTVPMPGALQAISGHKAR